MLSEIWERATAVHEPLAAKPFAASALVALGLVVLAWRQIRILITICHEAGHAVIGVLVGRRLSGIKLRADTSGVTVSRGKPTGPGMVATVFAGYPAASVVGLAAAWVISVGHAAAVLWGSVVLLGVMLLSIRNLYGWFVVIVGGVVVALVSWYASDGAVAMLAYWFTLLFLIGGPRPVIEVMRQASPQSDPGQLAQLTHIPRAVWGFVWFVITLGCLAGGLWLLWPAGGW